MKFLIFSFILALSTTAMAAPLKLVLNWKAEPQFGGFYAADVTGAFKKNKVDVQVLEGGSGTPTIQMLSSGQVDYAIVSADEVLLSIDRGAKDVVALFAAYQTNPQGIMTHAEKNYKSLSDVFKTDGVLQMQSGLPYAEFLKITYSPLKVKIVPYAGGIGAFQADKNISQQCFVTSEPLAAEKAGLKVKTFLISESGYNPYTTVLVTQASRLQKNPEEVKKVVQSVREGWASYLKDPKSTNEAMAKINKAMDLETFQKSARAQVSLIETEETKKNGLGTMTEARWKSLSDQLVQLKLIKTAVDPKLIFKNL